MNEFACGHGQVCVDAPSADQEISNRQPSEKLNVGPTPSRSLIGQFVVCGGDIWTCATRRDDSHRHRARPSATAHQLDASFRKSRPVVEHANVRTQQPLETLLIRLAGRWPQRRSFSVRQSGYQLIPLIPDDLMRRHSLCQLSVIDRWR